MATLANNNTTFFNDKAATTIQISNMIKTKIHWLVLFSEH